MKYEQTDFFDKLVDEQKEPKNTDNNVEQKDPVVENSPLIQRPDDGLSFDCEICQDAPGGCPSCGFGRRRK